MISDLTNITFAELIPTDIPELNVNDTLYSLDFRAISEDMFYKIPTMLKYENLLPWVLEKKTILVNEHHHKIAYPNQNSLLCITADDDPRISIYKRLEKSNFPNGFKRLYVGIPHPDADEIANDLGITISYKYTEFEELNDKIKQKLLFAEQTPRWFLVDPKKNKQEDFLGCYLKRQRGSGGYTIFSPNEISKGSYQIDSKQDWYAEDLCLGLSCSVQVHKNLCGEYTIFGFSEQSIENEKHFSGAKLKRLDLLKANHREQLSLIISKCSNFLERYSGFFGIDFIIDNNDIIQALEMNVRITAMTIPTLVFNGTREQEMFFSEDAETASPNDIVLTSSLDGTYDILRKR